MEAHADLGELRDRLADLERRHAAVALEAGETSVVEAMRFELAEIAWRLDELEQLAW